MLVFIGGIHGAGKTQLCRRLALQLNVSHYSAGDLIRSELSDARYAERGKLVDDVDRNQQALLTAVDRFRTSGTQVLLDGHFSLISGKGIEDVSIEVFRGLNPAAIVVADTDVVAASKRLQERDGKAIPLDTLAALRERELQHSRHVAHLLGVSFLVVAGSSAFTECLSFLASLMSGDQRHEVSR